MNRRTLLLVAAIVLALLGATAVYAYVQGVDERAIADQQPVEVLVAKDTIPAGTSGRQASEKGLLRRMKMPRNAVPEGALSEISPVRDLVTLADVFSGEVLLRAKFSESQATGGLVIPSDRIAVSVRLGDPQRVAGFVVPGSDVAIFVTLARSAGGAATDQVTRLLLPRVKVIAVGPSTLRKVEGKSDDNDEGQEADEAEAILTVAVTQAEGERLVHAATTGTLYFGLLSSQSATGPSQGVDNGTLFR